MPVTTNNIISEEELAKWSYLKNVQIPRINTHVDLLIGTNASRLMEPWEVINRNSSSTVLTVHLFGAVSSPRCACYAL